jgi:AraC-like DNA-binding protein
MHSHAFHKTFGQAFDTGERCFPQPYLLYASAGVFHLEAAQRSWLLAPHRAALIAPDLKVRVWTNGPATSASVLFAPELGPAPGSCTVFPVTPLLREMVSYAAHWDSEAAAQDKEAAVFFPALSQVARKAAAHPEPLWFPRCASADLQRAVTHTLECYAQPLAFADVAAAANAAPRTLSRRFAEEMGISWIQFLQRVRVVRAAEALLASRESIARIAYAHGFASASRFAQAFRDITGKSPAEYRRSTAHQADYKV